MTGSRARPALASDDWMLEQQVRAEMEAEAWRRLRADLSVPAPQVAAAPAAPPPQVIVEEEFDHHSAGSTILKAVVRFVLATFCAYLAYLAAVDSQLGEFEIWLSIGATFFVTLALSMFGFAREFVHMLAETARWLLISAVALGGVWILFQMAA
jgi:hypothetical protein